MTSTCPGCNKQVEHEDHLFEVECTCGNRFNPFMLNSNMDIPPMEPGGMGMLDEHEPEPPPPSAPPPEIEAPTEPPQESLVSFEESAAAFQEVREFGETLVSGNLPEIKSPPPSPGLPQATRTAATGVPISGDCLMTAGEQLSGYAVESYLPPVSVASDLNLQGGDPLKPAFEILWNQAKAAGANGVVALRWAMTPDASKVLLSGTPVRVTKLG